jgi:hypothetical protein
MRSGAPTASMLGVVATRLPGTRGGIVTVEGDRDAMGIEESNPGEGPFWGRPIQVLAWSTATLRRDPCRD